MRTRHVCWGMLTLALLTGPTMAQSPVSPPTYPAEMTIIVPEVEVRSGPTKQHYPTSKLHQGDRVTVLSECKDQPGWASIRPPVGAWSWIRAKHVKQVDARNAFVEAPDNALVSIIPASSVLQDVLNVESAKVPNGTLVVVLGRPVHCEGENWLPIQPMPTEVRYIPTSALRLPQAPTAVAVAAGFPTSVGSDVITRADDAYRAGNLELARQLYRQAADKSPEPQKSYALNRLASLSANGAVPVSAPVSSATHSDWQPGGGNPPAPSPSASVQQAPSPAPLGQTVPPPMGAGQPVSAPAPAPITANYTTPPGTMMAMKPPQWSGWGYLHRAGFDRDGQPVYRLETSQGRMLMYAVEQPGSRPMLSKMIGRLVCLYGPVTYRSGETPRIDYMVASHIATPP